MDNHSRSLVKTLSWRIIATLVTFVGLGLLTGDWLLSTSMAVVINVVKMVLYYGHERLWEGVRWGRRLER